MWAGGANLLLRTGDGGASWKEVAGPWGGGTIRGIWGSSPDDFYLVGDPLGILRSHDRGKSWTVVHKAAGLGAVWGRNAVEDSRVACTLEALSKKVRAVPSGRTGCGSGVCASIVCFSTRRAIADRRRCSAHVAPSPLNEPIQRSGVLDFACPMHQVAGEEVTVVAAAEADPKRARIVDSGRPPGAGSSMVDHCSIVPRVRGPGRWSSLERR